MTEATPELRIVQSGPTFVVARHRSVVFSIWQRTPGASEAIEALHAVQDLKRDEPHAGYLHIVAANNAQARLKVDDGARKVFSDLARTCDTFAGGAVVVEADGFFGATVRATVSGVILLARPAMPTKVFANLEEGARWLAGKLRIAGATPVVPQELLGAIARARISIGPRPRA